MAGDIEDAPVQVETIESLKDLFTQQVAELKQQNEETVTKLNETIDQLRKDNASLQAALVRSASMDPPKAEPVKSQEEIYREQIDRLKGKALEMFKTRGNYRCQQQQIHSSRRDSRT